MHSAAGRTLYVIYQMNKDQLLFKPLREILQRSSMIKLDNDAKAPRKPISFLMDDCIECDACGIVSLNFASFINGSVIIRSKSNHRLRMSGEV